MNVWAALAGNVTAPPSRLDGTVYYMDEAPVRAKRGPPKRRRFSIDNPWNLTSCQCQVAQLTTDGLSNEEIAGALGISMSSLEPHMSKVRKSMGGVNRARVAVLWDRFIRHDGQ